MTFGPDGNAHDLSRHIQALIGEPPLDLNLRDQGSRDDFSAWARDYDQRNAPGSYLAPQALADLAARHLAPGTGPILDLACGTGLLAQALHRHGLTDLVGIDLSPQMLALARDKGLYQFLAAANLHQPLPFAARSFAALVCCGAFYVDSVEPLALAHALPLIRPGGHLLCDIEMEAWEGRGFARLLTALQLGGHLHILHCAPTRMFAPGALGPEEDPTLPQGMLLAAQIALR